MKDQYIEIEGLLFKKCYPEPLEGGSQKPCLVKLIYDNSPMGRYNKETVSTGWSGNIYLVQQHAGDSCYSYYSRCEIVAKHCPEGSREWALWQMLNGEKVKHERDATDYYYMNENGMLVNKGGQIIEDESQWLRTSSRAGWQIYEYPKPKLEVGKWYWNKVHKEYCYAIERDDDVVKMRSAGTLSTYYFDLMEIDDLVEASLTPDFSNAKIGDKVYNVAQGYTEIDCIEFDEINNILITMAIKNSRCINDNEECRRDGRREYDTHPTYFRSAAQCTAYFAEVALKERGEE